MEKSTFMRQFLKNIVPAIISCVVLGTFSIIDGLFIGNKIGDVGLAAINIAWPITAIIQAIGFGIGMGGSVAISIAKGKGDTELAKKYLSVIYILFAISMALLMLIFIPTQTPLLKLFGASEETLPVAKAYITTILLATIPQVLSQGLVPITRNLGYHVLTMVIMAIGFGTNIFLDWLFIYPLDYGLKGAAVATDISQCIITVGCLIILLQKKHWPKLSFKWEHVKTILLISISPFGVSFAPNLVVMLVNKACSVFSTDQAIAAYTAVSYVTFMAMRFMQGVGDGAQPMMSLYYGAKNYKTLRKTLRYSLITSLGLAVIILSVVLIIKKPLSYAFGLSAEAREMFEYALPFFVLPFIGMAIMKVSMSYFYSQKKNIFAYIIVYLEPVFMGIIIFTLPLFMGISGIWIATPITQYLLGIVSIILILILHKNQRKEQSEIIVTNALE